MVYLEDKEDWCNQIDVTQPVRPSSRDQIHVIYSSLAGLQALVPVSPEDSAWL